VRWRGCRAYLEQGSTEQEGASTAYQQRRAGTLPDTAVTPSCRPSVSLILTLCRSKFPDNSPIHTLPAVKMSFLNFETNVTARCESNLFISRSYLSLLVSVIFNLKTAGITLGIVEFGAACLVSFLGPRTKEAGNAFTLKVFPSQIQ
jgi:hypothetical protein